MEGRGQTAVLPGAHHAIERFFRMQRDSSSGVFGPGGEGWCGKSPSAINPNAAGFTDRWGSLCRPRLDFECPNRCGLIYLPESVREQFLDADSESTPVRLPTNHTRGFACAARYVQPRDVAVNQSACRTDGGGRGRGRF